MAEIIKEEIDIEEFEIKEEIVSIMDKNFLSSTVEDTCSVDADMKGKLENNCKLTLQNITLGENDLRLRSPEVVLRTVNDI